MKPVEGVISLTYTCNNTFLYINGPETRIDMPDYAAHGWTALIRQLANVTRRYISHEMYISHDAAAIATCKHLYFPLMLN